MCDFVCGIMLHAKMLLRWSVIHNQITFERYSGCGLVMSIGTSTNGGGVEG